MQHATAHPPFHDPTGFDDDWSCLGELPHPLKGTTFDDYAIKLSNYFNSQLLVSVVVMLRDALYLMVLSYITIQFTHS